ncbi:MAG: hypothetical protein ACI9M9_000805 [Flavobacteriaceae bacterium]|jgi:hypothetical protein
MACSPASHNCISFMRQSAASIHHSIGLILSFCACHGIQKYVAHFSHTQLHSFTFAENTLTLRDIIWAVQ